MNVTSVEPFRARAVIPEDFTKGVRYTAAAGGAVWPGDLAEKVLGYEINFGVLFAYCFRRFGLPNTGGDPFKDVAVYTLTTPMAGVFLRVRISPTNASRLMFGYVMPWDVQCELMAEDRASNLEFHRQFSAWRKLKGRLLPRDAFEGTVKSGDYDQKEDMRLFEELLEQYCADGGTHYDAMSVGPKTQAVLDALCVAMEDLKTPVGVRDQDFSAVDDFNVEFEESVPEEAAADDAAVPVETTGAQGDDGEEDDDEEAGVDIVRAHPSAGYFVPPAYMQDPKRFVGLTEKLIALGAGDLSRGIDTFIKKEATAS